MKSLKIGLPDTCPTEPPIVPVNYVNAVERAGHEVSVLPYSMDHEVCRQMLQDVDVLLFMGGGDIDAKWFGCEPSPLAHTPNARRDEFEFLLFGLALEMHIPMMGICRGLQLINIALGGDIYQDQPSEKPSDINHSRPDAEWSGVHIINIKEGSRLHDVLRVTQAMVNSTHHQSVRKLGKTLHVTAQSPDGIIEAIESDTYPIAAVQFHPERLAVGNDTLFTPLFAKMKEFT